MKTRLRLLLLCSATLAVGQTTVYLPAPGALTSYTVTGATTGTPMVVTVSGTAPANGTALWIHDVGGNGCANGFWIAAGASGSTFQLTYMYYGGNAVGTTANCTGTYSGGGTAVVLTAYTLAAHPRVFLDGPSGSLAASLKLSGSTNKSNTNNPAYAGLLNAYNSWVGNYQNTAADQTDIPWCCYMQRYATGGLLYWATGTSSDETVAAWGIDHVEQAMGSPNNFYCAGDQCGNSTQANYITPDLVPLMQAYSMVRSQLSATEIQNFKDKILNDSAYLKNGLGVSENSANPLTGSCTNSNWSTWVDSNNYCGMIFYSRYLTYSPTVAPGQEGHYTSDYIALNPSATGPGQYDVWPHGDNLTLSKLYGYIAAGLALADDDVRARMLLTQSYTYFYRWYWAYSTSSWTPRNQGSRYTSFNVGNNPAAITAMMKNSCGLDLSSGNWLKGFLQFTQYQALPNWSASYNYMDQWGDVYAPDNDQVDWASVLAVPLWLYNGSTDAAYANYWMNNTMSYTSGEYGGESFSSAFLPYLFADPGYAQTNYTVATTQRLFKDTDYASCTTAFGSTAASGNTFSGGGTGGCYPNTVYGGAISKSDWTTTATQVNIQASFNQDDYDHSGCGLWGSYHIYRKDYLLSGDGSGAATTPNGAAHSDCTGNVSTDILIELGGSDTWNNSGNSITAGGSGWAYATIPRWASIDPTGDSSSRYMYMLMDVTPSYTSSAHATRVQRHLLHFKKASTQDYIVSYDDVALSSGTPVQDWMMYWDAPASGSQSITANSGALTVVSKNTTVGNFLGSSFLPVEGANTIAMIANGVTGATNRNYLCPSTNGTSCNNSAMSFEAVVVHKPSANSGDSMPTISQPSCSGTGGNCTVVDIQDASYPKVAMFARQGVTLTGASFTSTHNGTAQYLIAGLTAGSYTVTLGGSAISGSPFTVNANDNTLYFEGTSGAYIIAAGGGGGGGGTQGPAISSFTATPGTINSGQSSTLAWTVTGTPAPTLSISPTVGTVTGTSVSVSPTTTTTYTLTATNSAGSTTATAAVTVDVRPAISLFTATPGTISSGQSSTLAWTVTGTPAPTLSISPTVGTVTGTSVSVSPTTTTTYTLTATNTAGNITATAGVTVTPSVTAPSTPAGLVATAVAPTQVFLSWTASTSTIGIGGYQIYRNGAQIATTTTTATTYTDTTAVASTSYSYTVAAYDTSNDVSGLSAAAAATTLAPTPAGTPMIGTCAVFPSNNVWNTPINTLPVDPSSSTYISTIGASTPLHPDFSSTGGGIPYNIVPASQPRVTVTSSSSQNDAGPYPIPASAQVEQGTDQHVLVVDEGNCKLYELWDSALQTNGSWTAGSASIFDLNSNILRPSGWTSSDAAGLPVLPGLVRYEEVMSGQINHAIRMTAPQVLDQFIWPARHYANNLTGSQYPPMGERFRLQASFDVTPYSANVQVILNALKTYGAILADIGSAWYLTGAPNPNWNDSDIHTITQIVGSNMEAVDASSLEVDPNSAAVDGLPLAVSGIYLDQREVSAGATVNADAILTAPAPTGGAVVTIASSNAAVASAPASVTIAKGATSAPVALTIHSITNTTPVVLTATYQSVTAPSPVLFVEGTSGTTSPLLSALAIAPTTVTGAAGTAGTVTLTSTAPASGTVVSLSSSDSSAATAAASLTVPFEAASAPFSITTYSQPANAASNVGAQLNGEALEVPVTVLAGTQGSAPVISSFTATPPTISSGQSTTLAWSVSGNPAPTISINNGVGTVTGTSVSVSPTATTTYTLTASNVDGSPTAQTTVTVTASTPTYTLTLIVSPSGAGTLTPNPLPTNGTYASGTQVCLTAAPATGWLFSSWSGTALNASNCLTMNASASVTADFIVSPALRFISMTPCRVVDTRAANGAFGSPSLAAGIPRSFTIPSSANCTIPTSAAAYALNVTAVPQGALGYLTVWPTGQTQPNTSILNSPDGRIKANAAIIPAGTGGAISAYATNTTNLVLDIDGYFVSATDTSALSFYPLAPCRIADTRSSSYGSSGAPSLIAGQSRAFAILSSSCDIPDSAQAYSLNVTAIPSGSLAYVTAYPTGQTMPLASTLNDMTGTVTANAAIVQAGTGGSVDIYASNATNLVIDIDGYFAAPGTGGLSLYTLTPCRVLDSRQPPGSPPFSGEKDVNVTASSCAVPSAGQAYVFNATVIPPGRLGYLTLWPQGATEPLVSTLNAVDGAITSNMAVVPTTNGSIAAEPSNPTQLVLDIFGYFAP